MELTEKAAYVKGLLEGLELDPNDKMTKVINALVDLVNDMALEISDLEQCYDDVCDQIDAVDDDLANIEEIIFDDEYDEDDDSCGCYSCSDEDDDVMYEVTCPTCGKTIALTEDDLVESGIDCPNCGESLEFDYDEDELDEKKDSEPIAEE